MSFSWLDAVKGKGAELSAAPMFLAEITCLDGHVVRFGSKAKAGVNYVTYGGNNYECRLSSQDMGAIQGGVSASGFMMPSSFTLTITDTDAYIYSNDVRPHGWRGASLLLRFVMYDVPSDTFSTDSFAMVFRMGKPSWRRGMLTVSCTGKTDLGRMQLPNVPLASRLCPWSFPATSAERTAAASDPFSLFIYQCGYSPDVVGGRGNYQSGTTPYTSCDKTRAACSARGMFDTDSLSRTTRRFGGATWLPPISFNGKEYFSGKQTNGFNHANPNISDAFAPLVFGVQWVQLEPLAPAGDVNSDRSEVRACAAFWGEAFVMKLLVNGLEVPQDNGDPLFTYRYITRGGRTGAINGDAIYDGQGDPHGSFCAIEFVVPGKAASPGSSPNVQALVQGPPIPIFTADGDGTFTCAFSFTTNPVWHLLTLLILAGEKIDTEATYPGYIDLASFVAAAAICDEPISYVDSSGATVTHERFRSSFALTTNNRQAIAQAIQSVCNSARLTLAENNATGMIEVGVRRTLAELQPAPVTGSNYNVAVASQLADGTSANGYLAYRFKDAGDIVLNSLEITSRGINDFPNRLAVSFQNEENLWQTDRLVQIDTEAVRASGGNPSEAPLQALGICNYDQAQRIANAKFAEDLRGNPRNDADGTDQFSFEASVAAIHLCRQVGAICGIDYQQLSL